MHRRKTLLTLFLTAAGIFLLSPEKGHAAEIISLGTVFTNSCNGVCPDITASTPEAVFTLVQNTDLRGALIALFETPTAYQGGTVTWTIKSASTSIASGIVNMTQWDLGPVTVGGIPLEQYWENFSLGSGVSLVAGTYYLDIHSSAPNQFGLFWATNQTGLAFSLEGNLPSNQQVVPEPGTFALIAVGLIGFAIFARRRRLQSAALR